MQIEEIISVRGSVTVKVINAVTGIVEQEIHKDNLVVTSGKKILARLLGHDVAYTGEYVAAIGFGTSNTAAVVGQTALIAKVLEKAATVTYPADNSVKFTATMLDTEGGTSTYQEIGLLSQATGTLFSRLVISPITKSSIYKIQVEWIISFQ